MAKKTPPLRKWRLTAFPPGPRFVREKGGDRSTAVWSRAYFDLSALNRAAPNVHRRFPEATLVVMPFTWKGAYWGGDSRDDWVIRFCPECDARLRKSDGLWRCPKCGDEIDQRCQAAAAAIYAEGWTVEFREWCEDPETPGILGQIAGVCVHTRKAVKVKTHDVTTYEVAAVLEHELRHIRGAEHAGDEPSLGLACGGHSNAFGQPVSLAVWTGKRDGFSTRETWTSTEFPNYWIQHDDGAAFYVAGHRVAGPLGRVDKFYKAEDMVRRDAARSAPVVDDRLDQLARAGANPAAPVMTAALAVDCECGTCHGEGRVTVDVWQGSRVTKLCPDCRGVAPVPLPVAYDEHGRVTEWSGDRPYRMTADLEASSVTPAWVDQTANGAHDRSGDADYSEREQNGEDITEYDITKDDADEMGDDGADRT